ncbi:MAG: Pr6Pr family membrane protein [Thermomicrobiales bacterium]
MTKRNLLIGARLCFGLLALIAIGRQLAVHIHHGYSVTNFFSYFTNLSNIFAAVVLLLGAFSLIQHRDLTVRDEIIRGTSVVCMALVGIVFSLLLRDQDLGSLLPWVNVVLHYIMPVIVVLDWLAQPPKARLTPTQAAYWLIFPALYLAYSIIRGAIVGWYAYPFFDPAKSGGAGGVALYCVAILAVFAVVCWLFILLGNRVVRHVS